MMKLSYRALLSGAGVALFIMAMNPPALAAKIKSSRCGGWEGECNDLCKKNFRLDGNPSGCHTCRSCTRSGQRDCSGGQSC